MNDTELRPRPGETAQEAVDRVIAAVRANPDLLQAEEPPPPIVEFDYYLHDSYSRSEFQDYLEEKTGFRPSDELMERIGRPFYEVTLRCTLDTATGEVKLVTARL
jgi:hypothetical protein